MIEDPPLLTVRRNFPRPAAALVKALSGTPTGYLIDAMGGRGALDHTIKPLAGVPASMTRLGGVAVTCLAGPSDNLAVFAAIDIAKPGDIIVAATDRFSAAAVTGDLLLGMAKNRGIAGVGLPVFCSGITPNSPARNGPGLVGMPVQLGGLQVDSGDLVVGDQDGIVIVPRAQLKAVQSKLADVRAAEAALEAKVRGGLEVPDFIQRLLDSGRVRYLD